jgi:hypothetical protein
MAEKASWDQANRQQKLGLVWRNRKKISQIIKDYFYLPFFLLIILWVKLINLLARRALSGAVVAMHVLALLAERPSFRFEGGSCWRVGLPNAYISV